MNYDDKLSSGGNENYGLDAEIYDTSRVRKSKLGKATAAVAAFSLAMLAESAMAQDTNSGIDGFVDLATLDGIASVTRLPDGGLEILLSDGRTLVIDASSVQSVGNSIFVSQDFIYAEGLVPAVVSNGSTNGSGFGTVGLYVGGAAGLAGAAMAGIGGGGSSAPAFQDAVGKVNAVPEFEAPAPVNAAENSVEAFQKIATCSDGDIVTYSLSGTDADLFNIDVNTGVVTFKEAPNFENPSDANGDNVYEVVVSATDGEDSASLSVNVTVTDVVEAQNFVGTSDQDNFVGSEEADTFTQIDDGDVVEGLEGDDEISITGTGFSSIAGGEGRDTLQIGQNGLVLDLTNPNTNVLPAEGPSFASVSSNISGIEVIDFGTSSDTSITLDAGGIASLTEQRLEDGNASIDIIGANGGFVDLTNGDFLQGSPVTENGITYIIYSDGSSVVRIQDTITVEFNANEAPEFTSATSVSVSENGTLAYTSEVFDPDGDALAFSLAGTDAQLFTIDAVTGVVSFIESPDFETPSDANGDNVYDIIVQVSDGQATTSQAVTVTVTDEDDNAAPVFTFSGVASFDEGQTLAYLGEATDADGDTLTYSISGVDASVLTINAATGFVSFNSATDFEAPIDANGDNVYEFTVTVTDGVNTVSQNVTTTINNVNDSAPVFSSATAVSLAENTSQAYTAVATDADGDAVTFSLSGTDSQHFSLDSTTGVLTFIAPPDFEAPADGNGDNVYDVIITASDGAMRTPQAVAITVTNENDNAPTVTSPNTVTVNENNVAVIYTATAVDADGDAVTFSLSGADAALFTLDAATGALTFNSPPEFDAPTDANGDNVYDVIVTASDGTLTSDHGVAITVTNLNDNAPVVTSANSVSVSENVSSAIYTATATDADGDTVTFSLSGADAALFTLNATTGELTFNAPPDFEAPTDANGDNVYDVIVTASDGTLTTDLGVAITVTNENDNAPIVTSPSNVSVNENISSGFYTATAVDADGDTLTYTLSGADASLFTLDAATGVLSFIAAPDFEAPSDGNGDNIYDVIVTASDGTTAVNQSLAVTVTNVNDNAPVFVPVTTFSIDEETANVAIPPNFATDADGDAITYSISGIDAALVNFDAATGLVTFITPPDFEAPSDANGDNVYEFIITASDGTNSVNQALSVSVLNENDNSPVITSGFEVDVNENSSGTFFTATATDADGDTVTFSLTGTDAALFNIDAGTGEISFVNPPDFEAPADANGDNVYEVFYVASDGGGTSASQVFFIRVNNTSDNAPVITSPMTASVAENASAAYTVTATDADGDTLTYSLSGADAALFNIDPASGLVSFITPPDHETPMSAAGNNDYVIIVTANDGAGQTTDQTVTITVTNVDDNAPVFQSPSVVTVAENVSGTVLTAAAFDADGDAVTYALSGVDAGLFNIDANTGVVTFITPPDFEIPTDANGDNVYEFIVIASGQTNDSVFITVTNENDNAPVITSPSTATIVEPPDGSTAPEAFVAYTAVATDADGDTITYSLSGTDASLFTIDAATGVVSFITLPDFEAPADSNGDNVYDVVVTATDGTTPANQPVSITVTNQNDNAPVITSPTTASVAENASAAYTVTATDADGDTITYSLSGADASLFNIDPASGLVSFISPPDHEAPGSAQGTNDYVITVTADDGTGQTSDQTVTISVTNVDDNAPVFSSPSVVTVAENVSGTVLTAMATDADGDTVTYALAGNDAGLFNIDANTGVVTFITPPDFEFPTDGNGDNIYEFVIIASGQTNDTVSITVTNENDNAPVITSPVTVSVAENTSAAYTATATDGDGDTVTFSISGADAALFTVDPASGLVSFITPPDHETPMSAGGDSNYSIIVTADDGAGQQTNQAITITVTNENDSAPVFTSGATATVAENQTVAYTATTTDADGSVVTYSLSGADAALFSIDTLGVVEFLAAPDFENPADAGGDNVYDIIVNANDGVATTPQAVTITVTDDPSLADLDGTNGFRLDGIDAGDFSGASVSSAGDVNGDGFDDFIIGAVNGDTNGVNAGESYVVFGGATVVAGGALDLSTLDGTNGFRVDGIDSSDRSGSSVSSAGDINGDGFDDLIIGAHTARANGDSNSGESYVVFGGAALVAGGALDLSTLDGTNGFRLDGIDAEDRSGRSVSSAGDINGDGYDDLIISGYGGEPNGDSSAGESYVVFGGATVVAGGALDLSTLDGTNGFRIDGIDADDNSGRSVSSAGDVNGDGFDDLIIAARYADPNGDSTAGESYVVFGGAAIVAGGELDLSNLDGTNGFRLEGIDAYDRSGYSVSSAGDVNGDGFDDLIIGANLADPNGVSSAGESYVVFGGATVVAGGALDLSTLDGTNGFRIDGVDANDNFGFSVSSAGDVNGDGFDDLIIGASFADPNGASDAGESYVVFGGSSVVMGGALDLSTLDGTNGFRIDGIDATDNSGGSVSSAGDVNGDGFDDLIIGARRGDPNGDSDAGESYIVFGGATGTEDTAVVTSAGTAAADNFTGNAGDDDFTNISTGDVVRGGAGDDNITVTSLDFADIRGGSGIDLLVLNAAGVTLDVTTAGNASIGSIEIIDITGSGNNTIVVNAQAVFDISEERESGTAGLDIRGDAGDTVDLTSGNFFQIGSEMIDGFTYNVYEQGSAVVRVQDGMTVVGVNTAEPLDDTDGPVAAQSSAAREDVWFEQSAVEPSEIYEFNVFGYEFGFDDVIIVQSQWHQDFDSFSVGLNIQSMFWENSALEDAYQDYASVNDVYLAKSDVEPVSEFATVEFGTKAVIVPVSEHGLFDKTDIVTIAEVEPEFDVSRADPQEISEFSGGEGISIVGLNSSDNILSLSMGWKDQIVSEGDYDDNIFQDLSVDLGPSGLDDTGVFVSLSINDGYSSGTFNPTFADDWNSVELVDILEDFLLFVDDGQDLGIYTSFDG